MGLWNEVCRVKVSQEVQIGRVHTYVAVTLELLTGDLWWAWQANMKNEERARIRRPGPKPPPSTVESGIGRRSRGCGHAGHRGASGGAAVLRPEPDPVERFFQELRRALGDRVYPTLKAKKEALEPILKAWPGPVRVRQLRGWDWIQDALTVLPADTQVS